MEENIPVKYHSHQYRIGFFLNILEQKQNQGKKILDKCKNKCAASYHTISRQLYIM